MNSTPPTPNDLPQLPSSDSRPKGWSRYSKTAYYSEKFGLQLKEALDEMIANPEIEKSFSCKKLKTRQITIYNKVYQSWLWIIDHIDGPDKVYSNLRKLVSIRRYPGEVRLSRTKFGAENLSADTVDVDVLAAEDGIKAESAAKPISWKDDLIEFVESAPEGEVFEKIVRLAPDDLMWLSDYLEGVSSIIAPIKITAHKIKLAKNKAMAEAIKRG